MIVKNKILIGGLISFICIGILFFTVDLNLVWNTIFRLNGVDILLTGLLYVISFFVRTRRWITISSIGFQLPFRTAFEGLTYGYVFNQILPAKLGEVFRAEYVVRRGFSDRSAVLGSIIVERLFDVLLLICFFGISIIASQNLQLLFTKKFFLLLVILVFFVLSALILFYCIRKNRFGFFMLRERFRLKVDNLLSRFSSSFLVFKSPVVCSMVVLQTLVIWSITGCIFYVLTMNLSITIPWYGYFFIISAGTFGMIIPSTSGNVGVYHLVAMTSMMVFDVSKEDSLAFAILAHALDLLSNLSLGAVVYLYSILDSFRK